MLLAAIMVVALLPLSVVPSYAASLSYDSSIAEGSVYLGGVKLVPGKYLPVGASFSVDEKPEGGYAYFYEDEYSNYFVELHNYTYEGAGTVYNANEGMSAVLFSSYSASSLYVYVYGESSLTNPENGGAAIVAASTDIRIRGYGILTLDADWGAYTSQEFLNLNKGKTIIQNAVTGIQCESFYNGGILSVTASGNGICVDGEATFSGNTEITAGNYGIFHLNPDSGDNISIGDTVYISSVRSAIDSPLPIRFYDSKGSLTAASSDGAAINADIYIDEEQADGTEFLITYGPHISETIVYREKYNSSYHNYKGAGYVCFEAKTEPVTDDLESAPSVKVAGITLYDGDYLKTNVYVPTKEKPADGGYAYYKDGVLTLNSYRHVSSGTQTDNRLEGSNQKVTALIHSEGALTLKLEGENYLENTDKSYGTVIATDEGNIALIGDGALEGKSVYGIFTNSGDVLVTDVTLKLHIFEQDNPYVENGAAINASGDVDIDSASITVTCENSDIEAINGSFLHIDRSTLEFIGEGEIDDETAICGNAIIYSSNITVRNMRRAIDSFELMKNCTVTAENCEYGIYNDGAAFNCVFDLKTDEPLHGSGSFVDCELKIEGDGVFSSGASFIGCTINAKCENSAIIASYIHPHFINCDTFIKCKYLSWYDAEIMVQGGDFVAYATEKLTDDCDFNVYVGKGKHFYTFGESISNFYAEDRPINGAYVPTHAFEENFLEVESEEKLPNAPTLTVGCVGLKDGEYLGVDASAPTAEKPASGGYAYFADGVLTLHNYTVAVPEITTIEPANTAIYSIYPLTLILEGENTVYDPNNDSDYAIICNGDLTIGGNGTLNLEDVGFAACVFGDLTLDGNAVINAYDEKGSDYATFIYGDVKILSGDCKLTYLEGTRDVTVEGGSIKTQFLIARRNLTVNGGELDIGGLVADRDLTVNGGRIYVNLTETGEQSAVNAGAFTMNGGELTVYSRCYGIHSESAFTVNGGKLYIESYDSVMIEKGYTAEFKGGDTEIVNDTGTAFYHYADNVTYLARITGGTFILRGFMMCPMFDLYDYVACDATYAPTSDFSDMIPYENGREYSFLLMIKPDATISFNANGGTGDTVSLDASGETTLPECTFTAPVGKTFKGWSLTADGATLLESVYADRDIEIFAIWEDDPDYVPNPDPDPDPEPGTTPGGDETDIAPDGPTDNDKDGLGAGAIALIVIGSALVVGIGGFAIFWFVIKKKSFAELTAVFKKK